MNKEQAQQITHELREYGYDSASCEGLDRQTTLDAADRLESQECEIEELKSEAIVNALENAERIANMTDRAEQAEAREKAAIAFITRDRYCEDCVDSESPDDSDACASCWTRDKKPNFRWRGLPQEGEKE